MGIREKLNDNPVITTILTIVILVAAGAFIVLKYVHHGSANDAKFPTQSYYSDDDGATWFLDDAGKIPPFDHNGKQAVRAQLFRCGQGGKPFIQRLESYDDDAKQKINERMKEQHLPSNAAQFMFNAEGISVKKPGDKDWIKVSPKTAKEWSEIMNAKCPDGTTIPTPVSPEEDVKP